MAMYAWMFRSRLVDRFQVSDREALDGTEDLTVGALKDVQFGICERPQFRAIEHDGDG